MSFFDKMFKKNVDTDKENEQAAEQINEQATEQIPSAEENEVEPGIVQAYEEYSEVNDDIMNVFDEATEEEQARLEKDLEKFSEITAESDEVKAKLRALNSVGKDIDEELMTLLHADETARSAMDSADEVKTDFVNEVTVYDTIERKKIEGDQGIFIEPGSAGDQIVPIFEMELAEPSKDFTKIIFLGICGILVLLIIIFTIVIITTLNTRKPKAEGNNSTLQTVSQPKQVSNNANYIYINSVSQLNGENIMLQKMVMDSLATVFYFDKRFSVEDYNITLVDDLGSKYEMDFSFYPFEGISAEQKTAIYFKPFEKNVNEFTLSIYDQTTDSKAEYSFNVGNLAMPIAKYAASSEDFLTDFDDVTAFIQSAQFSTTGSIINFSFNWQKKGEEIVFGNTENSTVESSVSLKQALTILPTKAKSNIYVFENENLIIGRMDFAPLKNLNGNVTITFKDLMKKIELNKEVNVEKLLFNKEDNNIVINAGNYDLCLDRLIYDSNKFVLVVHAVDNTISAGRNADDLDDESNRVEVVLDVQLIAVDDSGFEIPIDGTVFSRQEGSDIVFSVTNAKNFISTMNVNNFKLDIKSASFKIGDITTTLNLSEADVKKSKLDILIETKLIEAFESRLAYKSGEIGLTGVSGFSNKILDDRGLMNNYSPVKDAGEATYSAQVITYCLTNENQVVAAVQEIWKDESGDMNSSYYRTHQVVCDFDGSNLTVVYDTIQK